MYGKRNRQRLEARIQARRQEFRDRGIPIIDEGAIRSRPRSSQPDRAGPSSGSPTTHHHPGTRGPYSSRRSSGGQSASQVADDDGYSDDDEEDGNVGSRKRGKGQRGGRRSSSGLLSPRQATTIEAAGNGGARRRSAKRHLDHQDDADHRESGSDSEGALYGAQPMDHRSLFTFDDRVALVQLLSQCGPNPSPSDLLHFGAKVYQLSQAYLRSSHVFRLAAHSALVRRLATFMRRRARSASPRGRTHPTCTHTAPTTSPAPPATTTNSFSASRRYDRP